MSVANAFLFLKSYQERIERKIREHIPSFGAKTPLRDACEYALLNGGKRFRPVLVMMIVEALGHKVDVTEAALAVEYFHTASLIADDLPCMDNDDQRRDKPSTHKVFGESVALLATYALISAGYEGLARNGEIIKQGHYFFSPLADRIAILAVENVSKNTGILGATGGQFLDLFPPNLSQETIFEVLRKKTMTLFEISFVLGWLFGGGDLQQLPLVKQGAEHFGLAFQIADDINDQKEDLVNNRAINIANLLGLEAARQKFLVELNAFEKILGQLHFRDPSIIQLLINMLKMLN